LTTLGDDIVFDSIVFFMSYPTKASVRLHTLCAFFALASFVWG